MEIRGVEQFLALTRATCPDATLFRGQTQDWPLIPSIGRYPAAIGMAQNWRTFHDHLVDQYRRLGRPYLSRLSLSETDLWVHGQHHGLPTRLLDWSTNPLKALFFSVNLPEHDEYDGIFWALYSMAYREELDATYRTAWETELVPFLPDQSNPRLIQQEGCFLSYPLPNHCDPLAPADQLECPGSNLMKFDKFVVPAAEKQSIRRELSILGIRYRLLFPDIVGVAKGILLEELTP